MSKFLRHLAPPKKKVEFTLEKQIVRHFYFHFLISKFWLNLNPKKRKISKNFTLEKSNFPKISPFFWVQKWRNFSRKNKTLNLEIF
jgi:hypothetical protein